jgi:aerobic carbon-monoxide dehydrogenase large subunit
MGLLLSPFAHARIKSINLSNVRSSPEFIASLTGEDLVKEGVLPVAQNPWPPQKRAKRYHLAVGKVRFAGEPVAAILAKSKNSLEDLIERVEVEYEQLPVITAIEESKQNKALLYEDWKDNLSQTNEVRYGDVDKAIASASYVINAREGIRRQESAPIEPHAVLVSYDKTRDVYEVYSTVQSVHGLQNILATELNIPRQKFHVKVMDVGGGFGSKGGPSYPWPLLACLFARKTGLPVKWTATRTEEFLEAAAGRDEYCDITLACDKDGKIVALKARVECDVGVSGTQTHMPSMTIWTMSGPYRIPNVDLKVTSYVTNKMPIGPVRGAGAPEGCYFIERAAEIMAEKIGLDPIEFRRRNIGKPKKAGAEDYQNLLDTLARSSNYDELLQWRNDLYSKFMQGGSSGPKLLGGIGISARGSSEPEGGESGGEGEGFSGGGEQTSQSWRSSRGSERTGGGRESGSGSSSWQRSGTSDSARQESGASEGGGGASWFNTETARVVLRKDGQVTVYTGSSPHGQGHETAFAQLASEELGVPIENVHVVWGDTYLIPFGIGTFGSRSAAAGGSAVVDASRRLKSQLLEKASNVLGVDQKSLEVRKGMLVNTSRPSKSPSSVQQILEKLGVAEISADSKITLSSVSHSNAVQLCALILDVESGKVKISKYVVVEDAGRMINKSIVEGQVHGGVVHGIGGALLEELAYDDQGNLLTSTFMDYSIPTSTDSPDIEIFHKVTPSTSSLDGAKGVGESGTIASYAAVMNALNDALSQVRKGVEVNIAPALPNRIYAGLTGSGECT